MNAFGLKPTFGTREGYLKWLTTWRKVFKKLCVDIRTEKHKTKALQRTGKAQKAQKDLILSRAMGHKLMSLREDAEARWQRIVSLRKAVAGQPDVDICCRTVDFHFNKGHLEFPDLPMWVVKAKGQTFYVDHVDARCHWTTREAPEGSTKGMIRFRDCRLTISNRSAVIGMLDQGLR
jgi:hypothetical protein